MSAPVTWREICDELKPYPGRGWMVVRIVSAVLLATVLVMAFQIPEGWLSLYFCLVLAKPTTKQTVFSCVAILVLAVFVIPATLLTLKYVAEPTWLRLLTLSGVIFSAFFLAHIINNGDVIRNLAVLLATILTFPDVYEDPGIWEQASFWLFPMALAGMLSIVLTTILIRPEDHLPPERRESEPHYELAPDRWSNPEHLVYALKGTFAAMATYFIYTALNFQEIQTALMTCLILGLPTTGEIIHKMWLRISGAVLGALLALVAALEVLPNASSLAVLLTVVAVGSSCAAWVALSSPRIAYAGWQIALAQFMMITHSFGPSSDLTVLRDRLLGIMLGNIMMGLTYKYLWPEKAERAVVIQKAVPLVMLTLLLVLVGCQNVETQAPSSPSHPWRSAEAEHYRLPSKYVAGAPVLIDANHVYGLSELVDLALRNNAQTRVAWEQARAAAAQVGVAQAGYYPQLNLMAAAGYEHVPFPLPRIIFPQGYFYSDMFMVRPEVQLDWLLWDFGRREAIVKRTKEQLVAENFMFNANHQQVLWAVCRAYYGLINTRSALAIAEAALEESRMIETASKKALENGLATQAEYLQAKQFVAQCQFDVYALKADERKAEVALAQSVGVDPGQMLRVRDLTQEALPDGLNVTVETLIDQALSQRPDLRAQVAALRMAQATVEEVDAQAGPTVVATGNVGPVYSAFSAEGTPWVSAFEAEYGGAVALSLPLFDGFRRQNLKIAAEAEKRKAEAALMLARDSAVKEVWDAYIDFESAWQRLKAAEVLVEASEASRAATLASFEHGVASVIDVQTQQTKLIEARETYSQARIDIFLSASLLQFVTGRLSADRLEP